MNRAVGDRVLIIFIVFVRILNQFGAGGGTRPTVPTHLAPPPFAVGAAGRGINRGPGRRSLVLKTRFN